MRIIAAHAYHRIDYETVWVTCAMTFPELARRSGDGGIRKLDRAKYVPKRSEHDCAHGSLPSSEQMEQPVGELDS
jgi:hypothetical protein